VTSRRPSPFTQFTLFLLLRVVQQYAVTVLGLLRPLLRFLTVPNFCLGETFVSLSYLFRIGKSIVGEIIPDVCNVIVEVLQFSWNSPVVVPAWLAFRAYTT